MSQKLISFTGISLVEEDAPTPPPATTSQVSGLVEGITVAYERPAPTANTGAEEVSGDDVTSLDDLMAQMKAL